MTNVRKMEIILTNPQAVYFPGHVLEGQLQIHLSADTKLRGIQVECHGKGKVYWKGDGDSIYYASEDYLEAVRIVYGNGPESENEVFLREGDHVFPFQFVLPQGLPGSYEGKRDCYVRYWLKGTIDKPSKLNHGCRTLFTVSSTLDLNTVQGATTAVQDSDSKTVCCFCCESDPIKATLRLDRTGYVPGEAIICDAEIYDGTGRGTRSSKIKLLQIVTYKAQVGIEKCEYNECARIDHGHTDPRVNDIYSGERLNIPPLPPSYLPGCSLIGIDYIVKLSVDVVDTPFDLDVQVDVIIGTIPLQSVVQQFMPTSGIVAFTNQPVPMGAPVSINVPPPSYQECVFGKVDTTDDGDRHATGNMSFAPSYTYYDWIDPIPATITPSAPPSD